MKEHHFLFFFVGMNKYKIYIHKGETWKLYSATTSKKVFSVLVSNLKRAGKRNMRDFVVLYDEEKENA